MPTSHHENFLPWTPQITVHFKRLLFLQYFSPTTHTQAKHCYKDFLQCSPTVCLYSYYESKRTWPRMQAFTWFSMPLIDQSPPCTSQYVLHTPVPHSNFTLTIRVVKTPLLLNPPPSAPLSTLRPPQSALNPPGEPSSLVRL